MHLNKILDQIKHHPSPTEAIDKLGKALEKHEGVFVLEVRHTPATASATLPVFVSTTGSVSTASNNNNIPVVKGDSTPLVGSEISAGNRYWVYYNKCDNVIQVMNHYTVAAAPAA